MNVSGALFIVLEDVIRMIKQTEKTKKLKANIEKEKMKEKEKEKEKEKLRRVGSLTHCKSMEISEVPLGIVNRPRTGTLDLHFPVIDTEDERDKEAEVERALFEQARGRRKSINQRFRSKSCEDEEQAYDLEVSTKSESLTYASFNRRKAGHNSSLAPGISPVKAHDTSIGKFINTRMTIYTMI